MTANLTVLGQTVGA